MSFLKKNSFNGKIRLTDKNNFFHKSEGWFPLLGKQSQNAINKVSTSGNMIVFPTEGINVSNSVKIFPPLE